MNCCRLLKLERVKDYLLMEEEFVANQERLKPQEDKNQEDRTKVDDLRGSPMSVGNLEEIIDENHAIVSSSVGPEYYVNILSFVDKDQLEPGCSILLHNKVLSVVGLLQDEVDPMVSVMKVRPLLELIASKDFLIVALVALHDCAPSADFFVEARYLLQHASTVHTLLMVIQRFFRKVSAQHQTPR
jgi:hypothetical protein